MNLCFIGLELEKHLDCLTGLELILSYSRVLNHRKDWNNRGGGEGGWNKDVLGGKKSKINGEGVGEGGEGGDYLGLESTSNLD